MSDQKKSSIAKPDSQRSVEEFLKETEKLPVRSSTEQPGRLIFAMDATASRAATWDIACDLQGQMFTQTNELGGLEIQLVYFRGHRECKASKWVSQSPQLLRLMSSVTCLAGRTQIERVLKHALNEVKHAEVNALVYVGDSMEESLDSLGDLAGQLKLCGVPLFLFQEGDDLVAENAYQQLAQISGGAHCRLDHQSAKQLGELLRAVAIYAAGGRQAFDRYCRLAGPLTRRIGSQLGGTLR